MKNQSIDQFGQWVDIKKLETVICLEAVIDICYQTLAGFIHNQTIRVHCQRYEQRARAHQEELRTIFPLSQESEMAIDNKLNEYLVQLRPPYLFLRAVLNLAVNLTACKIDIYRYFSTKEQEHRKLLNKFVEDSLEEMSFLRRERDFQVSKSGDPQLKGSFV